MLIRISRDLSVNPAAIVSLAWERRHYFNMAGDSTLVITMADGATHRVRHEPHLMDGADAYEVEKRLLGAAAASAGLVAALQAAVMALRSYQYGNSAPELAKDIADAGEEALRVAGIEL